LKNEKRIFVPDYKFYSYQACLDKENDDGEISLAKGRNPVAELLTKLSCFYDATFFDVYAKINYDVIIMGHDTLLNLISAFKLAEDGSKVLIYFKSDSVKGELASALEYRYDQTSDQIVKWLCLQLSLPVCYSLDDLIERLSRKIASLTGVNNESLVHVSDQNIISESIFCTKKYDGKLFFWVSHNAKDNKISGSTEKLIEPITKMRTRGNVTQRHFFRKVNNDGVDCQLSCDTLVQTTDYMSPILPIKKDRQILIGDAQESIVKKKTFDERDRLEDLTLGLDIVSIIKNPKRIEARAEFFKKNIKKES